MSMSIHMSIALSVHDAPEEHRIRKKASRTPTLLRNIYVYFDRAFQNLVQ